MMLLLKENRIIEMISVLMVENQISNLVLKISERDITVEINSSAFNLSVH